MRLFVVPCTILTLICFTGAGRVFVRAQAPNSNGTPAVLSTPSFPENEATLLHWRDQGAIEAFPRESIVVKTIWELVETPLHGHVAREVIVWDPSNKKRRPGASDTLTPLDDASKPGGSWISDGRPSAVSVNLNRSLKCNPTGDYAARIAVPLSCFYYVQINQHDLSALQTPATNRPIRPHIGQSAPYYMILLGFHVTTKEIPDWTWQTYYWSRQAFAMDARKRRGNPADIQHANWRRYVMDTTLGDPVPADSHQDRTAVFNPYLEDPLPQGHGMASNCLSCHRNAVYHTTTRPEHPDAYDLSLVPKGQPLPDVEDWFNSGVQTDFLFSLAGRNNSQRETIMPPKR